MAARKSRVINIGPIGFPYPLSDDYKRGPTRSCLMTTKVGPHTTRYPEDMTKCWGSKRKKGMVDNVGARQVFRKYGHPYIFF